MTGGRGVVDFLTGCVVVVVVGRGDHVPLVFFTPLEFGGWLGVGTCRGVSVGAEGAGGGCEGGGDHVALEGGAMVVGFGGDEVGGGREAEE